MSITMDLLVIAHTGHVVAGVTRVGGGPDLKAEALAGDALPVRSIRKEGSGLAAFTAWLPSSVLEVKSAPLDARVLASPQDYVIDGGVAVRVPPAAAAFDPVDSLEGNRLDLDDAAGLPEQKVLALVADLDDPQGVVRVQAGAYPTNAGDDAFLPLTILPDDTPASLPVGTDCGIMVALAGQRLFWTSETVT